MKHLVLASLPTLLSSAAFAGDFVDTPLPAFAAGGPIALGVAAVGYIGYRIYKRNR